MRLWLDTEAVLEGGTIAAECNGSSGIQLLVALAAGSYPGPSQGAVFNL